MSTSMKPLDGERVENQALLFRLSTALKKVDRLRHAQANVVSRMEVARKVSGSRPTPLKERSTNSPAVVRAAALKMGDRLEAQAKRTPPRRGKGAAAATPSTPSSSVKGKRAPKTPRKLGKTPPSVIPSKYRRANSMPSHLSIVVPPPSPGALSFKDALLTPTKKKMVESVEVAVQEADMKWSAATGSSKRMLRKDASAASLDGLKGIENLLITPGEAESASSAAGFGGGEKGAGAGRSLLLTNVADLGASYEKAMSDMELGLPSPLKPGLVRKASNVISSVTSFLPSIKKETQQGEREDKRLVEGKVFGAKGEEEWSAPAAAPPPKVRQRTEDGHEKMSDKIIRSLQKALAKERKRSMRVLQFSEQLSGEFESTKERLSKCELENARLRKEVEAFERMDVEGLQRKLGESEARNSSLEEQLHLFERQVNTLQARLELLRRKMTAQEQQRLELHTPSILDALNIDCF